MSRRRRKRREPRIVVGVDPAGGPDTTAFFNLDHPDDDSLGTFSNIGPGLELSRASLAAARDRIRGEMLRPTSGYGLPPGELARWADDIRRKARAKLFELSLRRPSLVPEGPYLCSVHDDCREHPTQIREDQPHIAFECARLSGRVGTVLDMRAASAARFSRVRWRAKRLLDRLRSSYSSRMVFPAQSGAAVWAGAPAFLDANGMVTTQSTGHPFGRVLESHGNDVVVEVFRI